MSKAPVSARFTALALAMSIIMGELPAFANETPKISPIDVRQFDNWAEIPQVLSLTGRIVDDEDNPVRGVKISIAGKEIARSGRGGAFSLPDGLKRSTRLTLTHRWFAPRQIVLGDVWLAPDKPVDLEVIPYMERFDITPAGGTFKSGELTLEVPPGAVTRSVQVLAAPLPLDYVYNHDGNVEPVRLTAVDLVPHGLEFRKPVKLTMTVAREDLDRITDPKGFFFDERVGRFVEDPEALVEVDGHRASVTLTHFSPHAIADGRLAQSVRRTAYSSDADGDSQLTPADALMMLVASGGTQEAMGRFTQHVPGSVLRRRGENGRMDRDTARVVATTYSLGHRWEKELTAQISASASNYEFDCQMLLGRYIWYAAEKWEKVTPNSRELAAIEGAWKTLPKPSQDGTFRYFNWQGTDAPLVTQSLPGEQAIAVARAENGFQVYARRSGQTIARIRDTAKMPCPSDTETQLWTSADEAIGDAKGNHAKQEALGNFFHLEVQSTRDASAWGTFRPGNVSLLSNLACGSTVGETVHWLIDHDSIPRVREWSTPSMPTDSAPVTPTGSVTWKVSSESHTLSGQHLTARLYQDTPDGRTPFGFLVLRTDEKTCPAIAVAPRGSGSPSDPAGSGTGSIGGPLDVLPARDQSVK